MTDTAVDQVADSDPEEEVDFGEMHVPVPVERWCLACGWSGSVYRFCPRCHSRTIVEGSW